MAVPLPRGYEARQVGIPRAPPSTAARPPRPDVTRIWSHEAPRSPRQLRVAGRWHGSPELDLAALWVEHPGELPVVLLSDVPEGIGAAYWILTSGAPSGPKIETPHRMPRRFRKLPWRYISGSALPPQKAM